MAPALVRAQVSRARGRGGTVHRTCQQGHAPEARRRRRPAVCENRHGKPLRAPDSQGLELAVPGTYIAGEPLVTIAAFAPQLHVITSKQRPRKLTIHGSDGAEYMFLLKARPAAWSQRRAARLAAWT